ncbi:acyl carrier protein, partial [Streptomyces sp. NPDC003691]
MHNTTTDGVRTELQEWLRGYLAEELDVPAGSVDPEEPMSSYGLDSVRAITLLAEAEDLTGCELDPNAPWEYPTVTAFAGYLAEQLAAAGRGPRA